MSMTMPFKRLYQVTYCIDAKEPNTGAYYQSYIGVARFYTDSAQ